MADGPVWQFLKRCVRKDEDFNPRHMDNSDDISDEESQVSGNFTALVEQRTQEMSTSTMKAIY
jgi:hypothetical protein